MHAVSLSGPDPTASVPAHGAAPTLGEQLQACRTRIAPVCAGMPAHDPAFTLIFSLTDGSHRAHVLHATANRFDAAWTEGTERLARWAAQRKLGAGWLRVDWVEGVSPLTWAQFEHHLSGVKRNYFRLGLALDADMRRVLTEQELNANAMLYGGPQQGQARFNKNNFEIYLRRRFPHEPAADFEPERVVHLLATGGVYCGPDGVVRRVAGNGLDAGRRQAPPLSPDSVKPLVAAGAAYLARQVQADGQFVYGHFPCFDRRIPGYNTLRHASTLFAMLEAWELLRDPGLLAAIERGLDFLCHRLIQAYTLADGTRAAFLVDVGNEIKLGGNAVCLLALVKHCELTGNRSRLPLLEQLALGIAALQDPGTGRFDHVLNAHDLSLKQASRIIYYDGEAAFGLMRLYALTRDERWLAVVERAFDYFIAKQHWQAHDHWLSYCVNEITRWRPLEKYFRFGLQNVAGHLDFVLDRKTTFPTLLELMLAAQHMLMRLAGMPALRHLLDDIDGAKFERALHFRANYLLNGHFWPEMAMYFRKPQSIVGAFFIRHHSFRVRIDDVEHYLSGLVGYHALLQARTLTGPPTPCPPAGSGAETALRTRWTAEALAAATGGRWVSAPPPGWQAEGVSPRPLAGSAHVLCVADRRPGLSGASPVASGATVLQGLKDLLRPPAAVLCSDPEPHRARGLPILQVAHVHEAVAALARHARARFSGRVVGVAGPGDHAQAVALLTQALGAWGHAANPPGKASSLRNAAWNMSCLPPDAQAWVLELGLAPPPALLRLLTPDVLVLRSSAVAPFPLDAEDPATRLRSAPLPAATRVVMPHDCRPAAEALRARGVHVLSYGDRPGADVQLLDCQHGELRLMVQGRPLCLKLHAAGQTAALDTCAAVATLVALGLPPDPAVPALGQFLQSGGPAGFHTVPLGQGAFHLIDQSHDANPASMRAALALLGQAPCQPAHRVALLGDMHDAGPSARAHHLALAEPLRAARLDRVLLCGPHMRALHEHIQPELRSRWFADVNGLSNALGAAVRPGDWVLAKASRHIGMGRLTRVLKALS